MKLTEADRAALERGDEILAHAARLPFTMHGVVYVNGDYSLLRLLKGDGGPPIGDLPRLPGEGPVDGIRVDPFGCTALRAGRRYFLAFTSSTWVEAS